MSVCTGLPCMHACHIMMWKKTWRLEREGGISISSVSKCRSGPYQGEIWILAFERVLELWWLPPPADPSSPSYQSEYRLGNRGGQELELAPRQTVKLEEIWSQSGLGLSNILFYKTYVLNFVISKLILVFGQKQCVFIARSQWSYIISSSLSPSERLH